MKLLLVRHGQSVANAEGRIQGQFDSPLNDRGRDQARALAWRLHCQGWSVAAFYASDLSRAAETAEILADGLDGSLILDARLCEYDAGVLNGLIWREVEFLYADIWHGWHNNSEWVSIPGDEGNETFHVRGVCILDEVRTWYGGEVGRIARFIAEIDPGIPYALLGFQPHFYVPDLPRTSVRHAEEAAAAALAAGLARVRIGNRHLLSRAY